MVLLRSYFQFYSIFISKLLRAIFRPSPFTLIGRFSKCIPFCCLGIGRWCCCSTTTSIILKLSSLLPYLFQNSHSFFYYYYHHYCLPFPLFSITSSCCWAHRVKYNSFVHDSFLLLSSDSYLPCFLEESPLLIWYSAQKPVVSACSTHVQQIIFGEFLETCVCVFGSKDDYSNKGSFLLLLLFGDFSCVRWCVKEGFSSSSVRR